MSHRLRRTPKEVDVEAKRELAIELKGELDPKAEEENVLKANESVTAPNHRGSAALN